MYRSSFGRARRVKQLLFGLLEDKKKQQKRNCRKRKRNLSEATTGKKIRCHIPSNSSAFTLAIKHSIPFIRYPVKTIGQYGLVANTGVISAAAKSAAEKLRNKPESA